MAYHPPCASYLSAFSPQVLPVFFGFHAFELTLKTFQHTEADTLLQEVFDALEALPVFWPHQRDCITFGTSPASTTNTMHILFGMARHIEVENMGHIHQVQATGRHIGSNQQLLTTATELIHNTVALGLAHFAIKRHGGMTLLLQQLSKTVCISTGCG